MCIREDGNRGWAPDERSPILCIELMPPAFLLPYLLIMVAQFTLSNPPTCCAVTAKRACASPSAERMAWLISRGLSEDGGGREGRGGGGGGGVAAAAAAEPAAALMTPSEVDGRGL